MGLELLPQLVGGAGGVVGVAVEVLVVAGWACAGLRGKRHEKGKCVFCNINTKTITCLACPGLVGCAMASLGSGKPAAGGGIFRKSILPPVRALRGKIRRENGFSVLKSIVWCILSAI